MSHIQHSRKECWTIIRQSPWKPCPSWSEWWMLMCVCACAAQCVCLGCVMELIDQARFLSISGQMARLTVSKPLHSPAAVRAQGCPHTHTHTHVQPNLRPSKCNNYIYVLSVKVAPNLTLTVLNWPYWTSFLNTHLCVPYSLHQVENLIASSAFLFPSPNITFLNSIVDVIFHDDHSHASSPVGFVY